MRNFFVILGIILLIAAVAAVGVLGYYSKGFKDWSFTQGNTKPDQSDPTTPGGSTDPGGSTTSGGSTDPGDDNKEQWVTKTYQSEAEDLREYFADFGLQDYEQGFLLSIPASDKIGKIYFAVLSKELGETSKWYFAVLVVKGGEHLESGDIEIIKQFQTRYYSGNGYESVEFSLTDDIKILGIRRANSTEYTITYAVKQA